MRKLNKFLSGMTAAGLFCLGLNSAVAAGDQVEANIFYYNLGVEFVQNLQRDVVKAAKQGHLKLNAFDSRGDAEKQINQITKEADQNLPLLVNATNAEVAQFAMFRAKDGKLPVVFFHREPAEEVIDSYDNAWFIGTNRRLCGIYQAELLQNYIKTHKHFDRNGNGQIDYVLIKGPAGNADTIARSEAFTKAMKVTKHNMNLIDEMHCNWKRDQAKKYLSGLLDKVDISGVDAIISNNDTMALGALDILQEKGYNSGDKNKYIPIIGTDGLNEALEAIASGRMLGTVLQDTQAYAVAMVALIRQLVDGRTIDDLDEMEIGLPVSDERKITVPYSIIDRKRAKALLQNRDTLSKEQLHY